MSDARERRGGGRTSGGLKLRLYQNSLLLAMIPLFFLSWLAMALTEHNVYNQQQQFFKQPAVSFQTFVGTSYFWNQTLQNWQSEFPAIGVFAVARIYLRQRGSTESKPVGAPHADGGLRTSRGRRSARVRRRPQAARGAPRSRPRAGRSRAGR